MVDVKCLTLAAFALVVSGIIWPTTGAAPTCTATGSDQRFDCFPGVNATQAECEVRGCCWDPLPDQYIIGPYRDEFPQSRYPIHLGAPPCYYPSNYPTYSFDRVQKSNTGYTAYLSRTVPSPYPNDVTEIRMDVYLETEYRLRIKITDAQKTRYEVPWPTMPTAGPAVNESLYSIAFDTNLGFIISRKDTQEILFEATVGSWIYSDQFLQLSARLPNTNLYGIGQHNDNFKRSFDWQLIPLFSSLLYPDYGSHPFYLMMENSHNSHGVLLFNSNAMDVLLQPLPAISYRVTGGILDFYFLLGPTPNDVVRQYNELVGLPTMPPYWSLGFHLCRDGYGSANGTRDNWERNKNAGVPFDTQWSDIDYMDQFRDFTHDPVYFDNIKEVVDEFHANGYHFVMITDAGISQVEDGSYQAYKDGLTMDIFVKNDTGGYANGHVWPEASVFPDFTHPDIETYWTNQFARLHGEVPYDGAWIDMNEPTTFTAGSMYNVCTTNSYDQPPYMPEVEGGYLNRYTICMSSKHYNDRLHYNLHNLYGFTESNYTNRAMKTVLQKRPFVLSRSTAPGSGHYAAHWTGDIYSAWDDLRQSIPSLLNFNLYGIPMVGSDICGFRNDAELEMCQRWTQLGAFYPFARNHNENHTIDQDPVSLGPEMVSVAIEAITLRYLFLPFFYTQYYRAHVYGENVIRPLFFEFPDDVNTYDVQEQFMWGCHLMIIPVLENGTNSGKFYFPEGNWYLYPNETPLKSNGSWVQLDQPINGTGLQLALREGFVTPLQGPALTTNISRNNPFSLLVTLDSTGNAAGELFWDDGDTIDTIELQLYTHVTFSAVQNGLTSTTDQVDSTLTLPLLDKVTIYNVATAPTQVLVNGVASTTFTYKPTNQALYITELALPLGTNFAINWS